MLKKIIAWWAIIMVAGLACSCAKREPAQSPASEVLAGKISAQFREFNASLEKDKAEELFDEDNRTDFSKIENFFVRQSKQGEVGAFKLYSDSNVEYVRELASNRILKLQGEADNLEKQHVANNAEVRSYGNYVYYAAHERKDEIFKIIEDTLRCAPQDKKDKKV